MFSPSWSLLATCLLAAVALCRGSGLCNGITYSTAVMENAPLTKNITDILQSFNVIKIKQDGKPKYSLTLHCEDLGKLDAAVLKDDKEVIGLSTSPFIHAFEGAFIRLTYFNPNPVKDSRCVKSGQKATSASILVVCSPAKAEPMAVNEDERSGCAFTFMVFSEKVCQMKLSAQSGSSAKSATKPPEAIDSGSSSGSGDSGSDSLNRRHHISGASVFFIMLSMAAAGYFLCGMLYKRLVMGAQGVEQIPHYLMWRRCARKVQDFASGIRSPSRYRGPDDDSYRHYDADDLSFDQPPLLNHSGGQSTQNSGGVGLAANQEYQPVRVAPPSNNSLNAAGGVNSRTSGGAGGRKDDDADERLLQV